MEKLKPKILVGSLRYARCVYVELNVLGFVVKKTFRVDFELDEESYKYILDGIFDITEFWICTECKYYLNGYELDEPLDFRYFDENGDETDLCDLEGKARDEQYDIDAISKDLLCEYIKIYNLNNNV